MKTLKHMHQRIRKDFIDLVCWDIVLARIKNYVYHLEHARGENSWFSNPHMDDNLT